MKKKIALFMLMAAMTGFAMTGCAGDDTTATESSTAVGETTNQIMDTEGSLSEINCADYVTLGEYKGVEVPVAAAKVTDEEVDAAISDAMAYSMGEEELITEGVVENGDTVRIDYAGYLDGVAFEGGTAQDQDLTIGSGRFIPGFEEGLLGVAVGETVTLDLTFPEDYGNSELAGQLTQFEVTVNAIVKVNTPDLTEENVADVASLMGVEAEDVDTLRQLVYNQLLETAVAQREEEISYQVQDVVYNNSTIIDTPEFLKNRYYQRLDASYTYYASMYNMYGMSDITDAASFVEYVYGIPAAEYSSYLMDVATEYANQLVCFQQIAILEGLTVSDEEALKEMEATYAESGFESFDDFRASTPLDEFRDGVMYDKVLNFLIENAVIVDAE